MRTQVAVLVLALAGSCLAQGLSWGLEYADTHLSVPDTPTVRNLVAAIRVGQLQKDWTRVAERLQQLIDEYPTTPVAVGEKPVERSSINTQRRLGARVWAFDTIAELPEEGRKVYRTLYNPEARRLYAEADTAFAAAAGKGTAGERDLRTGETFLADIVARLRHTSYGPKALEHLADLNMERGDFEHALYYLRLLFPLLPAGDARSASTLAKAATLCAWLGNYDELSGIKAWAGRLDLLGLPDPRPGRTGRLRDTFDSILAARGDDLGTQDWSCMGGSPSNSLPAATIARPDQVQWYAPLYTPYHSPRGAVRPPEGQRRDTTHRPLYPVVDDGVAYFSNGLEVKAYDIWTGNDRWVTSGFIPVSEASGIDENQASAVAVGDDIVVSSMEVNSGMGSKVYQESYEIIRVIPRRILAAYDRDDGTLLWTTDPRAARGEASVRDLGNRQSSVGIRFAGAPVVVGDTVYAMGVQYEVNFNYFAVALDAATGEVRWRTDLCAGFLEQNMFGNAVREAFPAQPAISEGVFYAVTNHGVVAALDSRSGDLLWMYLYKPAKMPMNKNFDTHVRGAEWAPNPPIASGGFVVVAPTDSPQCFGLRASSGEEVWSWRRSSGGRELSLNRGDEGFDHLVGVGAMPGGAPCVILAGGRRVLALDLRDGTNLLTHEVTVGQDRDRIIGRPAIARDLVYLPTTGGVDIRSLDPDLSEVDYHFWRELLPDLPGEVLYNLPGNLAVADGILLSSGRSYFGAFYRWQTAHESLALALEREPDNPVLNLKLASVHYQRALASDDADVELELAAKHYLRAEAKAAILPPARAARVLQGAGSGLFHVHSQWAQLLARRGQLDEAVRHLLVDASEHAPTRALEVEAHLAAAALQEVHHDPAAAIGIYRELSERLGGLELELPGLGPVNIALHCLFEIGRLQVLAGSPELAVQAFQQIVERYHSEFYAGGDAWEAARRKVNELIDEYGREVVYADSDRAAAASLEALSLAGDVDGLTRLVMRYPNAVVAQLARLRIGELLLPDLAQRSSALESLRAAVREGEPEVAAQATVLLVRAHIEAGDLSRARGWLIDLRDRQADVMVADGDRHVSSRAFAKELLVEEQFAQLSGVELRRLDVPLVATPTSTVTFASDLSPPWLLDVSGSPPVPIGEPLLLAYDDFVEGRRTRESGLAWRAPLALESRMENERSAGYSAGLLIVIEEAGVVAVEPLSGDERWRWGAASTSVQGYAIGEKLVAVVARGADWRRKPQVVVLSSVDGSPQWSQELDLRRQSPPTVQLAANRVIVSQDRGRGTCVWFDALSGKIVGAVPEGVAGVPLVVPGRNRLIIPMRQQARRSIAEPWVFDLRDGRLLADNVRCPPLRGGNGIATEELAIYVSSDLRSIVVLDPGQDAAEGERTAPRFVEEATVHMADNQLLRVKEYHSGIYTDGKLVYYSTTDSDRSRNRRVQMNAFDPVTGARPWAPVTLSEEAFLELDPDAVLVGRDRLACVLYPTNTRPSTQGFDPEDPLIIVVNSATGAVEQTISLPKPEENGRLIVPPVARLVDGGVAVWYDYRLYFYGGAK